MNIKYVHEACTHTQTDRQVYHSEQRDALDS